jgi:siroheme synthase
MNSFVDMNALLAQCRAPRGRVFLVGAGPGDADLLTLRAARLLAEADVVVYDHLVGQAVLELIGADAERIYAGKERANHSMGQSDINDLLVRLARAGRQVVRLKGGDPFVFGRGGEELQALAAEGVPFEVVPGITAACGVAAYAGIPLTHRDFAQSCLFVTGHRKAAPEAAAYGDLPPEGVEKLGSGPSLLEDSSFDLDWTALARPRQTVVIYMSLTGLATICARLVEQGLPPDWPAAVVAQGTLASQRVVSATLATLAADVERAGLRSPCLTIVGEVVRLRDELAWFGQQADAAATTAIPHALEA